MKQVFDYISWGYTISGVIGFIAGLISGFNIFLIVLGIETMVLGYAWSLVSKLDEETESLRKQVHELQYEVDRIQGISKEIEEIKKKIEK